MTLWWPGAFPSRPYYTWFWATRPGETSVHPCEWPTGYYWFYKIPAAGGHREQLVFWTPVDKYYKSCWSDPSKVQWKANVTYIITYPGDTPNYGGISSFLEIGPPCGNWYSDVWMQYKTTRNQTGELKVAIQGIRQKTGKIKTAIAQSYELESEISATIAGNPELSVPLTATVQGEREKVGAQRAAIRGEVELPGSVITAIAHDFDLSSKLLATIQGTPLLWNRYRAAIKGENETTGRISVFIVKSREDQIMLEMENVWPQEFGFTEIPNSPSQTKDWRNQPLGT